MLLATNRPLSFDAHDDSRSRRGPLNHVVPGLRLIVVPVLLACCMAVAGFCAQAISTEENRDNDQTKPGKDRKSTRLNSSHTVISYAVFCLKKKKSKHDQHSHYREQLGCVWKPGTNLTTDVGASDGDAACPDRKRRGVTRVNAETEVAYIS